MIIKTVEGSENSKRNLKKSRTLIVIKQPWLGYLVMGCRFYFTEDIPTAAASPANGNHVYINEEFFNNTLKDNQERSFVVLHEILHIFFQHTERMKKNNYDKSLYNVASDYFINAHIDELPEDMVKMPSVGLLDKERFKKPGGQLMSSDEIYHKLLEENDNSLSKTLENEASGDIGEVWNGNGKGKAPLDDLPDETVSEEIKNENKQIISSAMAEANKQKNMGNDVGGLISQLNSLIEPRIKWNELLRDFIQSENERQDYTYTKVSRRSTGRVVFPSTFSEHLSVFVGIDSSGSMYSDDDLQKCVSELQGIIDNFESFFIEFWTCDVEAFKVAEFSSENGDDRNDIKNVSVSGGGGTEISSLIESANESENEHNVCVVLSDFHIPMEPYQESLNKSQIPVFSLISPGGMEPSEINLTNTLISKMD